MSNNSNARSSRRSNGSGATPKKTSPKRLFWICALLLILIVAGGGCGFISATLSNLPDVSNVLHRLKFTMSMVISSQRFIPQRIDYQYL